MFELSCDGCGGALVVNLHATANNYLNDAHYNIDEDSGKIVEDSIQQYLLYVCVLCKKEYKFTYQEWEKRQRISIAEMVMEMRKQKMFRTEINPQAIDADNGISFCGQCSGYFNDGTCMNDIIKQCTIRKKSV
jgi:hypothetical protein